MAYYDPKYRNDALIQALLQGNTLDQILFAFDPANFRQTPEPMPLYNPNPNGQSSQPGQGAGSSYLDQLLMGMPSGAPAAPAPAPAQIPVIPVAEEDVKKRKATMDGGGRIDRGGYGGLGMSGY